MTKRAKLSLDPQQRGKAPPPHGFGSSAADEAAAAMAASHAGVSATDPARRRGQNGGAWQAQRPGPSAAGHSAQGAAAAATTGNAWVATARVLARRPLVRGAAMVVLAGLSLYLLRRRLF
jgi:hypothetical protein